MYFARKITHSKWTRADSSRSDEQFLVPLMSDLTLDNGELSVWSCGDATDSEIGAVVLALATAKNRLDKVDIVWLADDQLQQSGLEWEFSEGRTAVSDLKGRHVSILGLDAPGLAAFARIAKEAIDAGRWRRFRKSQVRKIVIEALSSGRFALSDVHERLARELMPVES